MRRSEGGSVMTRRFGVSPVRTFVAVVGVVAAVGCGASDEAAPEKASPAAKASAAAVPEELVGTWTRTLSRKASSTIQVGEAAVSPYTFIIKVRRDGILDTYFPPSNADGACMADPECEAWEIRPSDGNIVIVNHQCASPGEYSYEVTGNKLRTTRVKDDCPQYRQELFDGATWR